MIHNHLYHSTEMQETREVVGGYFTKALKALKAGWPKEFELA